jgi:hypothetical protein
MKTMMMRVGELRLLSFCGQGLAYDILDTVGVTQLKTIRSPLTRKVSFAVRLACVRYVSLSTHQCNISETSTA